MPSRLCFICLAWLLSVSASAHALLLSETEFRPGSTTAPPLTQEGWTIQPLPDIWRNSHAAEIDSGWYRFRFNFRPDANIAYVVYLPKLDMNASV